MKTIIRKCQHCGMEFEIPLSAIKHGGGVYCNKKCYSDARRTSKSVERTCPTCLKPFTTNSNLLKYERGIFCSKQCRRKTSTHSVHHQTRVAANANRKMGAECVICGTKNNLCWHHEDYSKPTLVIRLCRSCHAIHHSGKTGLSGNPELSKLAVQL